jgi:hypothetical protein
MNSENGQEARDFAYAVLMNKRVRLDIDDLSAAGIPTAGYSPVARLGRVCGQPPAARNFGRLLVDSGHAGLECFTNNEFDPQDWRSGPSLQAEAEPLQGRGQDLQQNLPGGSAPLAAGIGRKGAGPGGKRWLGLAEWGDRGLRFSINCCEYNYNCPRKIDNSGVFYQLGYYMRIVSGMNWNRILWALLFIGLVACLSAPACALTHVVDDNMPNVHPKLIIKTIGEEAGIWPVYNITGQQAYDLLYNAIGQELPFVSKRPGNVFPVYREVDVRRLYEVHYPDTEEPIMLAMLGGTFIRDDSTRECYQVVDGTGGVPRVFIWREDQ